jgi:hypothetical protein
LLRSILLYIKVFRVFIVKKYIVIY